MALDFFLQGTARGLEEFASLLRTLASFYSRDVTAEQLGNSINPQIAAELKSAFPEGLATHQIYDQWLKASGTNTDRPSTRADVADSAATNNFGKGSSQTLIADRVAKSISPVSFEFLGDRLTVTAPSVGTIHNEANYSKRVEVCAMLAQDLLDDFAGSNHPEFARTLKNYISRLPPHLTEGNILIADAEARVLRHLSSSDEIPDFLLARLDTFFECHLTLRQFYPEIEQFYEQVRSGRLVAPLPRAEVDQVIQTMKQHTPSVFTPELLEAVRQATSDDFSESRGSTKTRGVTAASTINRLWDALLMGLDDKRVSWERAVDAMAPHVAVILKWLQTYWPDDSMPPISSSRKTSVSRRSVELTRHILDYVEGAATVLNPLPAPPRLSFESDREALRSDLAAARADLLQVWQIVNSDFKNSEGVPDGGR